MIKWRLQDVVQIAQHIPTCDARNGAIWRVWNELFDAIHQSKTMWNEMNKTHSDYGIVIKLWIELDYNSLIVQLNKTNQSFVDGSKLSTTTKKLHDERIRSRHSHLYTAGIKHVNTITACIISLLNFHIYSLLLLITDKYLMPKKCGIISSCWLIK